ncbi:hypothetical protein [Algoriphagus antarcticus]|uniref:Uncharacterized protein n=1 Tax=Algoriphagus antarcticus TaxID=238540 RepID=A0A3E0DJU4_9BACT|nr:hypothetical protein [Algoriphagus antarcticus]REG81727.1 hypothetical protein C8N25_12572 [Algoriphagus antarcticus]
MGGLIKYMYELPILEAYDRAAYKIRHIMDFPQTSLYADGNHYFLPFPNVKKLGDRWYLYFARELKYFVYKEVGVDLVLEKTVDMEVNDAVLPVGVPFVEVAEYSMGRQPTGMIDQFYHYKRHTIVIYRKGIPEEKVLLNQTDPSVELVNKSYAAVFDEENNLLKNDIPVPDGLIFSRAITENGEILALKNQEHFGVEEDFVVYYKLKMIYE